MMGENEYHGKPSREETVKGSFKYVIENYSKAKRMEIGKYISSDVFRVGGYEWRICFYPNGREPEDNAAYVSVFLELASRGTNVHSFLELTMMDQSDKGKTKLQTLNLACLFNYRGSMRGSERFFKKTFLEAEGSQFIKNDCLIINCNVGVVKTLEEERKHGTIPLPASDMGLNFKASSVSEVTFEVGDATFKANKLIVEAHSPIFKSQLNPDKLVIEDVEPVVFKAMLAFMHSDQLPDLHEMASSVPEFNSATLLQHLLSAAHRFGMDRLKLLCEAKFAEEVTTETVAITPGLLEQYPCPTLKSDFAAVPRNLGWSPGKKAKFTYVNYVTTEKECHTQLVNLKEFKTFVSFRSYMKNLIYGV